MAKAGTIEYKGIFFLVNSPLLSFAASTNNSKSEGIWVNGISQNIINL